MLCNNSVRRSSNQILTRKHINLNALHHVPILIICIFDVNSKIRSAYGLGMTRVPFSESQSHLKHQNEELEMPPICFKFRDSGQCSYGADCRFSHSGSTKLVERPRKKKVILHKTTTTWAKSPKTFGVDYRLLCGLSGV
jgi:hypothetical protein